MFRSPCTFLVGLFCCLVSLSAQPVVDQSFTPPASYGGYDAAINNCCAFVAQTYTAGLTGTLAGVAIAVQSQSAFPLHVAIRTVASGITTNTILRDVTLTSNSAALSQLIQFPQLIQQIAGVQYAIVVNYLGAPPPGWSAEQGTWSGGNLNSRSLYAGGEDFESFDGV